jgi:hypothetical protein|tara:strand:- start:471 stop:896 length:426 start_codon:yes stop_codon:yes gene_type:complete
LNRSKLIQIAGGVWVAVGIFLIFRGVGLYQLALSEQGATTMGVAISVIFGLIIGGAKGKFVLAKTAKKNKTRINALEEPVNIGQVFAKPFYIFILAMMGLGFLLRTYNEFIGGYIVVGAVYCGIGAALAVASLVYWKSEVS